MAKLCSPLLFLRCDHICSHIYLYILSTFFSNKENPYSTFGFSFWTFINVQNRKPPGAFENDPKKMRSEHNALISKKC